MALRRIQRAFLNAYELLGDVKAAAEQVGCERMDHYNHWLKKPEYKAAFERADENAIQAIDREIRRRALEGDDEPVIYQGKRCQEMVRGPKGKLVKRPLTIKRKSDILLMFLAKAKRPNIYRENAKLELDLGDSLIEVLKKGRKRLSEERERNDNIAGS